MLNLLAPWVRWALPSPSVAWIQSSIQARLPKGRHNRAQSGCVGRSRVARPDPAIGRRALPGPYLSIGGKRDNGVGSCRLSGCCAVFPLPSSCTLSPTLNPQHTAKLGWCHTSHSPLQTTWPQLVWLLPNPGLRVGQELFWGWAEVTPAVPMWYSPNQCMGKQCSTALVAPMSLPSPNNSMIPGPWSTFGILSEALLDAQTK